MKIRFAKVNSPQFFNNMSWTTTIILCLSIIAGTFSNIFSYFALILSFAAVVFFSERHMLQILMFIMPFANIFKPSPSAQSFFTYLLLFYVFYSFIKRRKYCTTFLCGFLFLLIFLILQMSISTHILRTIKFAVYILFIYNSMCITTNDNNKSIYLSYILGIITSSFVSILNIIPNLPIYIGSNDLGYYYDDLIRLAGLYGDPNYYSINLIIALCLIVIMFHNHQLKTLPSIVLSVCIVAFVSMTFSKSSFLMLLLPIGMLLYSRIKQRKYFILFLTIVGLLIFTIYVFAGKIELFNVVISRFTGNGNVGSNNTLTTGRFNIWKNYLEHFSTSNLRTFVGNGFGAELVKERVAHNTYLDMIHYLGIMGTGLTLWCFWGISKLNGKQKHRNFFNRSVWLCVLVMYFFLSELFYFDWPFHIVIAFYVYRSTIDVKPKIK